MNDVDVNRRSRREEFESGIVFGIIGCDAKQVKFNHVLITDLTWVYARFEEWIVAFSIRIVKN